MPFLDEIEQNLVFAVTKVQSSLSGEGNLSTDELRCLAEELDGALSLAGGSFGILCPSQTSCDGSCVASSQGVWRASKHVLLAIHSIL